MRYILRLTPTTEEAKDRTEAAQQHTGRSLPVPESFIHTPAQHALRLSGFSLESILRLCPFCSYPYRKHGSDGGSQGPHSYCCVPAIPLASCDDAAGNTIQVAF